ncbi:SpdD-like protein [Streptomyces sp. NBC_00208]|uniref:SpdD-like protein n=1 Tax=Streptomyces sp. NBC_00208 TaxID=2975681 RepID=UPI002E29E595|nr:SpdD-like protein [Streptomyces sp. NBC_00208]
MIRPRIPVNPLPTGIVTPLITTAPAPALVEQHHAADCACQHTPPAPVPVASGPAVRLSPVGVLAVVGGGVAVVLVVGAVLVSMLLAVAITGASVAVCAVVLRSLLNNPPRQR